MKSAQEVRVFAPATVSNVCVGFDILGFSVADLGDEVLLCKRPRKATTPRVRITSVSDPKIPQESSKNTAGVAAERMLDDLNLDFDVDLEIKKGIALGSGMGGSAASAVGAVFGVSQLMDQPCSLEEVMKFALAGEKIASASLHGDNVAPCIYGGLVAVQSLSPIEVFSIPLEAEVHCLLAHPHMEITTAQSRQGLRKEILLAEHVLQSAHLAAFVSACHRGDLDLLGRSMVDLLVEPQREKQIPNFRRVKQAAMRAGALGFSISGSGPSVFGWFRSRQDAQLAQRDVMTLFDEVDLTVDSWIFPVINPGVRVLE